MNINQILFSTEMVQAILAGRKTMTRQVVKPQPPKGSKMGMIINTPYGLVGDVLWVRETWQHTEILNINVEDENYGYVYKADNQEWNNFEGWKWKPSIHMPKAAARIFLEITNVRVERLQSISEADAIAEGIQPLLMSSTQLIEMGGQKYRDYMSDDKIFGNPLSPITSFMTLWQSINGEESWNANPWVWVVEFKRVSKPENF